MKSQQLGPYYLNFTPTYRYRLGARLAPYYVLHFSAHPFRRDLPSMEYKRPRVTRKRRRIEALIDAMIHIMMRGYTELVGSPLGASTGQLLLFLSRVVKSIDESFEKQLQANASLDLTEVMADPSVREKMDVLQAYLDLSGRREVVMERLQALYATHYQAYARRLSRTQHEWQFTEVLASAQFDSGTMVRAMLELVALFHGHPLAEGALEEFYEVGMVGKFADDMVDLGRDIRLGAPNLVYALVQQHPAELRALKTGSQSHERRNSAWWQRSCPTAYAEIFEHVSWYIARVGAPHLKLACDLCLVPPVIGRDYDLADGWEGSADVGDQRYVSR